MFTACPLTHFLETAQQNDLFLGIENTVLLGTPFLHSWWVSLQVDTGNTWYND